MAEMEYPVTVAVERGGRVEQVRVGTAVRSGDGFVLRLSELRIAAPGAAAASYGAPPSASYAPPAVAAARSAPPEGGGGGGGMVFPPYGRSKGQPIYGATMGDLEYYAAGCRRTLGDPNKARWHDKERVLLAAIEAEIIRQKGMPPMPASDEGGPPPYFDERPPPDDDTPF